MTKHRTAAAALALLLAAAGAAPAFAQGASQTPPSPNASNNMPQAANSEPRGSRTLPRGTTGYERMGRLGTAATQDVPASQPSEPAAR